MSREIELDCGSVKDGISSVAFGRAGSFQSTVVTTSWDGFLRVYDVASGSHCRQEFDHNNSPVLASCWGADSLVYTATADGLVFESNVASIAPPRLIGEHLAGVKCLNYSPERSLLFSGSWDKTLKCFDTRQTATLSSSSPSSSSSSSASSSTTTTTTTTSPSSLSPLSTSFSPSCIGSYDMPNKVFAMDLRGDKLVVGTSQRHIVMYDLRNMREAVERTSSPLNYQTRCIKLFPDGKGYALACIEGRVAIQYLETPAGMKESDKQYAFKCHRKEVDGVNVAYPVNCVSFHPLFGTFVTGGCDGVVCAWDATHKKRIKQFPAYPTSIAATDFNHDGSLLAIASSYTFEQGPRDSPLEQVFVRSIVPTDVKPRSSSSSSSASSRSVGSRSVPSRARAAH